MNSKKKLTDSKTKKNDNLSGIWNPDLEAYFLDNVERWRPIGVDRDLHVLNLCIQLNAQFSQSSESSDEDPPLEPITPDMVWKYIQTFWRIGSHSHWPEYFPASKPVTKKSVRRESAKHETKIDDDHDDHPQDIRWESQSFELPTFLLDDFHGEEMLPSASSKRFRKKNEPSTPTPVSKASISKTPNAPTLPKKASTSTPISKKKLRTR